MKTFTFDFSFLLLIFFCEKIEKKNRQNSLTLYIYICMYVCLYMHVYFHRDMSTLS